MKVFVSISHKLKDSPQLINVVLSLVRMCARVTSIVRGEHAMEVVTKVEEVILHRRGFSVNGVLLLSQYHLVFQFHLTGLDGQQVPREIWIAYPVIDRISKLRGSAWLLNQSQALGSLGSVSSRNSLPPLLPEGWDHYTSSHIRVHCKDFTYYLFDFKNDAIGAEVFQKMSELTLKPKRAGIENVYAFSYKPNVLEQDLKQKGWQLYDCEAEYKRMGLTDHSWRVCTLNKSYQLCSLYPQKFVVPLLISDNVVKHASKFRSKQRIPAVVYRHRANPNHNVIARCAQPLVGINIQNRSIQDEQLVGDIFRSQERDKSRHSQPDELEGQQPQRNLIVDLRPLTNAMAQHALGAGTENIDFYRGKRTDAHSDNDDGPWAGTHLLVDKIYGNIDNIHVIRDLLSRLQNVLNDMDRTTVDPMVVQHQLVKSQWLHRVLIILLLVDRIIKLIHLNNTNVIIHCLDGWDRTLQVSALAQMCLDPYYRTLEGFMVLIEKEWVSFGFKFATRADHGGCIGALKSTAKPPVDDSTDSLNEDGQFEGAAKKVALFFQRAAQQVKNVASDADGDHLPFVQTYSGLNEKLPVFHQFLDCVFQVYRQHSDQFEFNLRFLKRLLYHYYACQYGLFLLDNERELLPIRSQTVSVWDYFILRRSEFTNKDYSPNEENSVVFFSFTDVRWWCELYGRSEEDMNGMANKLEQRFAQLMREPKLEAASIQQSDDETKQPSPALIKATSPTMS